MNTMVGFSRAIKQEWLTKTVELTSQTSDEQEIKERLNDFLSYEIKSPTNLRKTREILMNIWVRPSDVETQIKAEAIRIFHSERSNRTALNWAMILLTYPVFSDVCGLIGKISLIQDTFTTSWLREKLLSIWGERYTLIHSTDKILQTLKYLGVIENVKVGVYKVCPQCISDSDTTKVMLLTLLALGRKAYYEVSELSRVPLFFPFEYDVTLEWLHNIPEISIGNFGGKIVVSAKE